MRERPASEAHALMELMGGRSFMTVSSTYHQTFIAYVCVSSFRPRQFAPDDAVFLRQATNQIIPVLEYIRLVDRMASDAADEERRRIARSVHDRVIQPYIGLQMGLKALDNLVQSVISDNGAAQHPDECQRVAAGLDNLMKMTQEGIEELRNYV